MSPITRVRKLTRRSPADSAETDTPDVPNLHEAMPYKYYHAAQDSEYAINPVGNGTHWPLDEEQSDCSDVSDDEASRKTSDTPVCPGCLTCKPHLVQWPKPPLEMHPPIWAQVIASAKQTISAF
jgi:hypothetical protein